MNVEGFAKRATEEPHPTQARELIAAIAAHLRTEIRETGRCELQLARMFAALGAPFMLEALRTTLAELDDGGEHTARKDGTPRTAVGVFFSVAKELARRVFAKTPRGTPVRSYYRVLFFDARKPAVARPRPAHKPKPPRKTEPASQRRERGHGRDGSYGGRRPPAHTPEVIKVRPRAGAIR